jgi:hypothetical protein
MAALKEQGIPNWVTVALEEYNSMRTESLQSMKNQLSSLQVGTASIGVLIAAGFSTWDKGLFFSVIIFLLFVPAVCYISLVIWIGEVVRMMRAGKYIAELEIKINSAYPATEKPLNWENWLRTQSNNSKTPQLQWNYKAILTLFFATAFSSICIGIGRIYSYEITADLNIYITIGSYAIFFLILLLIYLLSKKIQKS